MSSMIHRNGLCVGCKAVQYLSDMVQIDLNKSIDI